ncbi:MAG: hypothetical protein RLZZ200_2320 [Pseudomonadota bacterium]|jgi:RND family efflux transporter MFP subunit
MKRPVTTLPALPALLGALLLVGLTACSKAPSGTTRTPTYVSLTAAVPGPGEPSINASGVLWAKDAARLSFKVGGLVRAIPVNAGDPIVAGQVLAEIETTEIDAQVAQARELADKALRDLSRGERLQADEVIPLEQLQNLRTQAGVARAQLAAAEFNRGRAIIRAPRDGLVLRRLAEPGELLPAGQPVLVVGSPARGYVLRVGVSDRDLLRIRAGQAATVRLDARPGEVLPATISEVAAAADERTGLFTVEARLAATDAPLATGLVGHLELTPANGVTRVYVPMSAVVEADGGRASVFVAEGGKARKRVVQVAFIAGDRVALSGGLAAGEEVVASGAPFLDDGDTLNLP